MYKSKVTDSFVMGFIIAGWLFVVTLLVAGIV
jgi:hypothetical protein